MKTSPIIRLRGIRQVIPSGYVMGRVSSGDGDAELIPISLFAAKSVGTGIVSPPVATAPAEVGWELDGPFTSQAQFKGAFLANAVAYPSIATASYAACDTAPLAATTIYVVNNLASFLASGAPTGAIAHIDFAAGATTGTVTWYSATVTVPAYTALYLVTATLFDFSFAGVNVLLIGDYS